ncbi:peptide ABC transporter ATP-binding protein [Kurthia sibirica]|uniref:Peptide ABC transporter ATP-binding protein n=2 Tax=Kurthia sibirica TaxID=202750 RepID=A0A2U3AJQ7_9BACL|nr:ABC transporter ATP-binding protein [Kurthia sibirica]PWI24747.1 peptide ABC transporter ATP-binding protein [Kurthia sibirica]
MTSLLSVRSLTTAFDTEHGKVVSVDDVSFDVQHGETLAIVGESGSGKSVTALSVMHLLGPTGSIESGELLFDGQNITALDEKAMQKLRGNDMSMIFQEPMTALNPVLTIGNQLIEAILLHQSMTKKEACATAINMLEKVGLPRAAQIMKQYAFSLSGGMRQRVMIAMALVSKPKLLIADEPTTALDVTVQAQIMRLLKELCQQSNTSIMLITHDLGVVAEMADQVIVMYAGQIVEIADVYTLFEKSLHPYTEGLLASIPSMVFDGKQLESIPGSIPARYQELAGCRFANRCKYATERCRIEKPQLEEISAGHFTRCFEWQTLEKGGVAR